MADRPRGHVEGERRATKEKKGINLLGYRVVYKTRLGLMLAVALSAGAGGVALTNNFPDHFFFEYDSHAGVKARNWDQIYGDLNLSGNVDLPEVVRARLAERTADPELQRNYEEAKAQLASLAKERDAANAKAAGLEKALGEQRADTSDVAAELAQHQLAEMLLTGGEADFDTVTVYRGNGLRFEGKGLAGATRERVVVVLKRKDGQLKAVSYDPTVPGEKIPAKGLDLGKPEEEEQ